MDYTTPAGSFDFRDLKREVAIGQSYEHQPFDTIKQHYSNISDSGLSKAYQSIFGDNAVPELVERLETGVSSGDEEAVSQARDLVLELIADAVVADNDRSVSNPGSSEYREINRRGNS